MIFLGANKHGWMDGLSLIINYKARDARARNQHHK